MAGLSGRNLTIIIINLTHLLNDKYSVSKLCGSKTKLFLPNALQNVTFVFSIISNAICHERNSGNYVTSLHHKTGCLNLNSVFKFITISEITVIVVGVCIITR